MSTLTNTITFKFGYQNSTETRSYTYDIPTNAMNNAESVIQDINASLKAGTDDGLSEFFISDTGAQLAAITSASIKSVEETIIF